MIVCYQDHIERSDREDFPVKRPELQEDQEEEEEEKVKSDCSEVGGECEDTSPVRVLALGHEVPGQSLLQLLPNQLQAGHHVLK